MRSFQLRSDFELAGDQCRAVEEMSRSLVMGERFQTLLGVTGSGKTFTMANIIAAVNKPTLIISHNKTLAGQLYSEFKGFFPNNAVEYFVSYYDYYQPEAYVPQTDLYIEKDASINENIDRLRLSATSSLLSRKDVVIVASVSCIYGLGSPEDYSSMLVNLKVGEESPRSEVVRRLVDIQYTRNDTDLKRGSIRVRGDIIEVFPSYKRSAYRIELFGDEVYRITEIHPVSGDVEAELEKLAIYPAKHFVTTQDKIDIAVKRIEQELEIRVAHLKYEGKVLEAQRLLQRTRYDMDMLREAGYCSGIENYSRHISDREAGSRPWCLIDYFGDDFLVMIDESHVTLPQLHAMYNGDRARKKTLVDYGFRLPSALDNRPLKYEEFMELVPQILFVSATPGEYELSKSSTIAEQVIRPTGLVDPPIIVLPTKDQIYDLVDRIKQRAAQDERVLVTTLTKRLSEELTRFLKEMSLNVRYLHSEINALDRIEIIRDLRKGEFDCLVGINLLREGLDLPEVSLVAVLDADKEGFLRSWSTLVQVSGRAARNVNGEVVFYADKITPSMKKTIEITNSRRKKQLEYNKTHGITPTTIRSAVKEGLETYKKAKEIVQGVTGESEEDYDIHEVLDQLEQDMQRAARNLEFEKAIAYRDQITGLRKLIKQREKE